MKPKLLFISAAHQYYESSATNRNRPLVDILGKYFDVSCLEVCGSNMHRVFNCRFPTRTISIDGFREPSSGGGLYRYSRFKGLVSSLLRKALPDQLVIKLVLKDVSGALSEFNCAFDFVFTSSDPKGVYSLLLNPYFRFHDSIRNAKFAQYWGDPLVGDLNLKAPKFLLKTLEYLYLKRAHRIFFASHHTMAEKRMMYADLSDRMFYLPRYTYPETQNSHRPIKVVPSMIRKMTYAGDYHSKVRNMNPLVEAVIQRNQITLSVLGKGDLSIKIADNVRNIRLLGRVGQLTADMELSAAELIVVLLNRSGTQVPGKIYDLQKMRQPICVIFEHESQIEMIPFKSRFIFVKNDTQSILKFLESGETYECSVAVSEVAAHNSIVERECSSLALLDG